MFRRGRHVDRKSDLLPILSDSALADLHVERPGIGDAGACRELVAVWYVALRSGARRRKDDFDPYFITRCACDWVGTAYDAQDPSAFAGACAEAFGHSENVAAEVARILD